MGGVTEAVRVRLAVRVAGAAVEVMVRVALGVGEPLTVGGATEEVGVGVRAGDAGVTVRDTV